MFEPAKYIERTADRAASAPPGDTLRHAIGHPGAAVDDQINQMVQQDAERLTFLRRCWRGQ